MQGAFDQRYRPDVYGKCIIIERRITRSGTAGGWTFREDNGKKVKLDGISPREELTRILDHFTLQVRFPSSRQVPRLLALWTKVDCHCSRYSFSSYYPYRPTPLFCSAGRESDCHAHPAEEQAVFEIGKGNGHVQVLHGGNMSRKCKSRGRNGKTYYRRSSAVDYEVFWSFVEREERL